MTPKRRRMARWLRGQGIEIGALHNPLELPPGATVRYVDRLPREDLARHYAMPAEKLVPVDVIGNAMDLSAIPDGSCDFVIANHLIEHIEDPIRGLGEMARVLRPGGVLYMAVPEPRVTFDRARRPTAVEHLVEDYRLGPGRSREAHFREWVDQVEANQSPAELGSVPSGEERVRQLMELDYSIHFHVYRPHTLVGLLEAARQEAGVDFEVGEFVCCDGTDDDEFIFVLLKGPCERPPRLPPELPSGAATPPPPPSIGSAIRTRAAASRAAPILRPMYRAARRLAGRS